MTDPQSNLYTRWLHLTPCSSSSPFSPPLREALPLINNISLKKLNENEPSKEVVEEKRNKDVEGVDDETVYGYLRSS